MVPDAVPELVALLPDGVVVTSPEALEKYRFDWTHDASAGMPVAAVRVESAAHVQETMRWASDRWLDASELLALLDQYRPTGRSGDVYARLTT